MILNKIHLRNFKPYIGDQVIEVSPGDNAPLILVYGENNRGKSSLFDAIRWALYGQVHDRVRLEVKDFLLMNDNAWKNGQNDFLVMLEFEHEKDNYVLSRACEIVRNQGDQRGSSKQKVFLKRNNDFVPNEEISRTINEILNEKISIFFLCDMEVLSEYENLVKNDSAAAVQVKQAIEDILGVPALVAVRDALKSIESEAFKDIKKLDNLNSDAEKLKKAIIEEQNKRLEKEKDDKKITARLTEKKSELQEINKQLEKFESALEFIRLEQELQKKVEDDEKEILRIRGDLQIAVKESWWLPISQIAEKKFEQTQSATALAASRQEKLSEKQLRLKSILNSLETGNCSECRQSLPSSLKNGLHEEKESVESEIAELSKPLIPSIESLVEESSRLSHFRTPSKASLIGPYEKKIRQLRNDVSSRHQSISDLKSKIGEIDRDDVQELHKKRTLLEREIGAIAVLLKNTQVELNNLNVSITKLNRDLANCATTSDVNMVSLEHAVSSYLSSLFENAVDDFRESTKREVEKLANDIFKRLVSKNAFSNLRINENYGLRLMDDQGILFDHRGAGVEQVVALSLILALGKASVRSAALVLDTPFARLDDVHRDNILRNIWKESKQVILLLQSGEKISKSVNDEIAEKIARNIEITKGTDPKESFIKAVGK
jgi:DNA sulfur modification protein DndD